MQNLPVPAWRGSARCAHWGLPGSAAWVAGTHVCPQEAATAVAGVCPADTAQVRLLLFRPHLPGPRADPIWYPFHRASLRLGFCVAARTVSQPRNGGRGRGSPQRVSWRGELGREHLAPTLPAIAQVLASGAWRAQRSGGHAPGPWGALPLWPLPLAPHKTHLQCPPPVGGPWAHGVRRADRGSG